MSKDNGGGVERAEKGQWDVENGDWSMQDGESRQWS
jgi:hypothetical protein